MSDVPQLGKAGCILEGIVTTLNADQTVNISPMGPIVDSSMQQFHFRPYKTSTTYQNLKRTGYGIFHITDDVYLFAQAALGTPDPLPDLTTAEAIEGQILTDCCRWYAFEITSIDDSEDRTNIFARTVDYGRNRDFFGFNRAKHAVLEVAILATRLNILPVDQIHSDLERLASQVSKTASQGEQQAFNFLHQHIESTLTKQSETEHMP